uniref:Uncharacterized protein n=1 Tax=Tetranychus urticae TaxID=32264 RepID=T1K413_TETUR
MLESTWYNWEYNLKPCGFFIEAVSQIKSGRIISKSINAILICDPIFPMTFSIKLQHSDLYWPLLDTSRNEISDYGWTNCSICKPKIVD